MATMRLSGNKVKANVVSDPILADWRQNNAEVTTSSLTPVLVKEIIMQAAMTTPVVRFTLFCTRSDPGFQSFGQIYKNGSPIGALQETALDTPWVCTEQFSNFLVGDKIQIYAYRVDTPAAHVKDFNLSDVPLSWHSPDGFVDSMGMWSDEPLAYDGNTATFAYVAQNLNMWTQWCRFTFSTPVLLPTKFRIWMSHEAGATPDAVHIKAYDGLGGVETIWSGNIPHDQYVELNAPFTESGDLAQVSYLEVRFEGHTGVTKNIYLNEVAFYGQ